VLECVFGCSHEQEEVCDNRWCTSRS
jgi:hypothetical protein